MRRLRRKVARQERAIRLRMELLELLELLEHPPLLEMHPWPEVVAQMPPALDLPPLTQEEIEELRSLPMPDPLEEIQHRLASTTPSSQQT